MQQSIQAGDDCRLSRRRAWLCLLLSFLFLYNPFLATPGPSATLSASHAASFRATVASSELLALKSNDCSEAMAIAASDLPEVLALLQPQLWFASRPVHSEESLPNGDLLSGDLWFRPPPTA